MPTLLRNTLAIIFAILAAALVSSGIIILGHSVYPPPEGIDTNDFESIKNNFHLFQSKHFVFSLISHAIGTFVSAYIVSYFASNHKFKFALGIGIAYMIASLVMALRLGQFHWLGAVELCLYIPMSILAYTIYKRRNVV